MDINLEKYKKIQLMNKSYLSYKNMHNEFRPYVMFTNAPNYQNQYVNTDEFGFRLSSNINNKKISLKTLNKEEKCNVVLGGSTVFGMGASSDAKTIPSYISKTGIFCQNFGVRGATSHQEFLIFQNFVKFLPRIKNVYLISGVNDLAVASQDKSFFYPEFGCVFSEEMQFHNFWSQYSALTKIKWQIGKSKFFIIIDYLCRKFFLVRKFFSLMNFFLPSNKHQKDNLSKPEATFNEKFLHLKKSLSNDLRCWNALSKEFDFKIIYVLQPAIRWSNKKLNNHEKFLSNNQRISVGKKFYDSFMNKEIYQNFKKFVHLECKKNEIDFLDSNEILNEFPEDKNFFLDLCHLTDDGNEYIAKKLIEKYEK